MGLQIGGIKLPNIGGIKLPNVGGWVNDRKKEVRNWVKDPVKEAGKTIERTGKNLAGEVTKNVNNVKAWANNPGKEAVKTFNGVKQAGKNLSNEVNKNVNRALRGAESSGRAVEKTLKDVRQSGRNLTRDIDKKFSDFKNQPTRADLNRANQSNKPQRQTSQTSQIHKRPLPGGNAQTTGAKQVAKGQPSLAQAEKRISDYSKGYQVKANGKTGGQKWMDSMRKGFNEGYDDDQFKNIGKSSKALATLKSKVRDGSMTQAQADQVSQTIVKKFNTEEVRVTKAQVVNAKGGQVAHVAGRVVVVGVSAVGATAASGGNIFVGAAAAAGAGSVYDAVSEWDRGSSVIAPKLDNSNSLGGAAARSLTGKNVNWGSAVLGTAGDGIDGLFGGKGVNSVKAAQQIATQIARQGGGQATRHQLGKAAVFAATKNSLQQSGTQTVLTTTGIALDTSLTGKQRVDKALDNVKQTIKHLPIQALAGVASSYGGVVTQLKNAPADVAVQLAVDGATNIVQASLDNAMVGKGFKVSNSQILEAAITSGGGAVQNLASRVPMQTKNAQSSKMVPTQKNRNEGAGAGGSNARAAGSTNTPKPFGTGKTATTEQRVDALGKAVDAFHRQPGKEAASKIKAAQQDINNHRDESRAQGTWSSTDAANYKSGLKKYAGADQIAAQYQDGVTPPSNKPAVKSTPSVEPSAPSRQVDAKPVGQEAPTGKNPAAQPNLSVATKSGEGRTTVKAEATQSIEIATRAIKENRPELISAQVDKLKALQAKAGSSGDKDLSGTIGVHIQSLEGQRKAMQWQNVAPVNSAGPRNGPEPGARGAGDGDGTVVPSSILLPKPTRVSEPMLKTTAEVDTSTWNVPQATGRPLQAFYSPQRVTADAFPGLAGSTLQSRNSPAQRAAAGVPAGNDFPELWRFSGTTPLRASSFDTVDPRTGVTSSRDLQIWRVRDLTPEKQGLFIKNLQENYPLVYGPNVATPVQVISKIRREDTYAFLISSRDAPRALASVAMSLNQGNNGERLPGYAYLGNFSAPDALRGAGGQLLNAAKPFLREKGMHAYAYVTTDVTGNALRYAAQGAQLTLNPNTRKLEMYESFDKIKFDQSGARSQDFEFPTVRNADETEKPKAQIAEEKITRFNEIVRPLLDQGKTVRYEHQKAKPADNDNVGQAEVNRIWIYGSEGGAGLGPTAIPGPVGAKKTTLNSQQTSGPSQWNYPVGSAATGADSKPDPWKTAWNYPIKTSATEAGRNAAQLDNVMNATRGPAMNVGSARALLASVDIPEMSSIRPGQLGGSAEFNYRAVGATVDAKISQMSRQFSESMENRKDALGNWYNDAVRPTAMGQTLDRTALGTRNELIGLAMTPTGGTIVKAGSAALNAGSAALNALSPVATWLNTNVLQNDKLMNGIQAGSNAVKWGARATIPLSLIAVTNAAQNGSLVFGQAVSGDKSLSLEATRAQKAGNVPKGMPFTYWYAPVPGAGPNERAIVTVAGGSGVVLPPGLPGQTGTAQPWIGIDGKTRALIVTSSAATYPAGFIQISTSIGNSNVSANNSVFVGSPRIGANIARVEVGGKSQTGTNLPSVLKAVGAIDIASLGIRSSVCTGPICVTVDRTQAPVTKVFDGGKVSLGNGGVVSNFSPVITGSTVYEGNQKMPKSERGQ